MILLRHGESEFNRRFSSSRRDPGIPDPGLTHAGRAQAERAAAALASQPIARIIVSPYTRALETAALLAGRLFVPIAVSGAVRERFAFSCDVGTPRTALAAAWPAHDFSTLAEVWWPETTEAHAEVIGRAHRFRDEMAAESAEGECLVISHWGFIMALTGKSVPNGEWLRVDPMEEPPSVISWRV